MSTRPSLRAPKWPLRPEAPASSLLRDGQSPPPSSLLPETTTPRQPAREELQLPACPARQRPRTLGSPHYISRQAAGAATNPLAPGWSVRGAGLASAGVSGSRRGSGAGEAAPVTFPFGPPPLTLPSPPPPLSRCRSGAPRMAALGGRCGRAPGAGERAEVRERPVGWGPR